MENTGSHITPGKVYHSVKEYHIDPNRFYAMHMATLRDISVLEQDFQ
jgi:hypothetical protein